MVKSKDFIENFIKEVKPQVEEILKKTDNLRSEDGIMVWIQKNHVEASSSCDDGSGYRVIFTLEDGKLYAETIISAKVEVLEDGGDLG